MSCNDKLVVSYETTDEYFVFFSKLISGLGF